MKYLVTQSEMKQYDKNTIEYFNYPSIVLMERAALATVEHLRREMGDAGYRVLVVSGCGNNGGDGIAVGRLLMLQGCKVDFTLLGNRENFSKETALQLKILEGYGYEPYDIIPESEYDIVIDAVFGIGLSRDIEGIYKEAVLKINEMDSYVCSIDIPSGIHAGTGHILGCAVRANLTVSYGFIKLGEILYPGAGYCGKIICGQMGIDERSFLGKKPYWYTYDSIDDIRLPMRRPDGNKGTFGKVLVIAGSDSMCGAAVMTGRSVFRMGAGMVKIVTSQKNRDVILEALPEAMLTVYGENFDFEEEFEKSLSWADCILIGPGIGTGSEAVWMLNKCLNESSLPIVIDADGLNILADMIDKPVNRKIILTPHLGEFARLYGCSVKEVSENLTKYPQKLADSMHCIVVCKDARTIVACPDAEKEFINTSGNAGMATAGSGDVLAGIITGLLAQGMEAKEAAVMGVCLHGFAGDMASACCGERSMTATDIIDKLQELIKKIDEYK
ncbi:MAG: NAD(P)H-hydrate dehydratase [Lachnospiraceae bacterium]|nr:NAD(P)H-hydrate dehydratase [Lachnospiraceae bacterium]